MFPPWRVTAGEWPAQTENRRLGTEKLHHPQGLGPCLPVWPQAAWACASPSSEWEGAGARFVRMAAAKANPAECPILVAAAQSWARSASLFQSAMAELVLGEVVSSYETNTQYKKRAAG